MILSGLSGAGKTSATKLFEDLGYACMDNLPGELLPALAELVSEDRQRFERVAIVLDVRAGDAPLALAAMRGALEGRGIKPRVVFLEARDEVLIRRFSETRHRHPLAGRRGIAGSIAEERRLLDPIRAESDIVVDTSDLSLRQLKERVFAHLADNASDEGIVFQLISFGFKYGVPLEADLVFDVRFMENPYYVDELRHLSGLTPAVRDYVMGQPIAQQFFDFLARFLDLTVPGFKSEGKTRLTVAIGCTGGYHRSIVIAEQLRGWLVSGATAPWRSSIGSWSANEVTPRSEHCFHRETVDEVGSGQALAVAGLRRGARPGPGGALWLRQVYRDFAVTGPAAGLPLGHHPAVPAVRD